jgi:hypothetical protein
MMNAEDVVADPKERQGIAFSLRDLSSAATALDSVWAIMGGHALIAWGVPRDTPEIDAMVDPDLIEELAATLVGKSGWVPLECNDQGRSFLVTDAVTLREKEDPVMRAAGPIRIMIPLGTKDVRSHTSGR